jgi:hypothetical protein
LLSAAASVRGTELNALLPELEAAIQSAASEKVAITVPVSAAAQFAGCAPLFNFTIALTPIAVSAAFNMASRTATLS